MLKQLLLGLLFLILGLSLTACTKKDLEETPEKATGAILKKVVNKASGGRLNLDSEGDVLIETGEGQMNLDERTVE